MTVLTGKVALVTGGSRGIGAAIAQRFAPAGALVAVHYGSNRNRAEKVVAEIEKAGGQAFTLKVDVCDLASTEQMFEAFDSKLEKLTGEAKFDILVNNTGIVTTSIAIGETS